MYKNRYYKAQYIHHAKLKNCPIIFLFTKKFFYLYLRVGVINTNCFTNMRALSTFTKKWSFIALISISLSPMLFSCLYEDYNYIPVPNRKYILYNAQDTLFLIFRGDTVSATVTSKDFILDYGELFSAEYTEKGNLIVSDIQNPKELINISITPHGVMYRFLPDSSFFPDELIISHINFSAEISEGNLYTDLKNTVQADKIDEHTWVLSSWMGEYGNAYLHFNTTEGIKKIFVPGHDTLHITKKKNTDH